MIMTSGSGPTDGPTRSASADDAPLEMASRPSGPNPLLVEWGRLNPTSQLIAAGSIAAILVTIVGIVFGAWDSADFVLIVLIAAITAGVAAWATRQWNQPMAVPLPVIELVAGAVLAVLAVWNVIEVIFDLDSPRGGIFGVILTLALAAAAVATFMGALRRNGGPREALMPAGMWPTIALAGLGLVLLGWALNLSVGYWTMAAATLSLTVLTVAAIVIVVSRGISSPVPAAWVGVVLAVFGVILALEQWGKLATLGDGRGVDISIVDLGSFFIYVLGVLAILGGGVLTALEAHGMVNRPTAG